MQTAADLGAALPHHLAVPFFGQTVGAGMADSWKGVLDEIDALLDGEKLIPYWRVSIPEWNSDVAPGRNVGINLARLLNDPGDMDVVL